jgi:hypothetical protein
MDWKDILTILLPLLAMLGWVYKKIEIKVDKIHDRFDKIELRFIKVDEKLDSMNMRLMRLEGRFEERGYWESRIIRKTGTENQE